MGQYFEFFGRVQKISDYNEAVLNAKSHVRPPNVSIQPGNREQGGIVPCNDPYINVPLGRCELIGGNETDNQRDDELLREILQEIGISIVPNSSSSQAQIEILLADKGSIDLNIQQLRENPGSTFLLIIITLMLVAVGWTCTGSKQKKQLKNQNRQNRPPDHLAEQLPAKHSERHK